MFEVGVLKFEKWDYKYNVTIGTIGTKGTAIYL